MEREQKRKENTRVKRCILPFFFIYFFFLINKHLFRPKSNRFRAVLVRFELNQSELEIDKKKKKDKFTLNACAAVLMTIWHICACRTRVQHP